MKPLPGVMDLVFPSDFSPSMRGVMLCQLVLVLSTGTIVLACSTLGDRTQFILAAMPAPSSSAGGGGGTDDGDGGGGKTLERVREWVANRRRASLNAQVG